jgi:hypothetical protein
MATNGAIPCRGYLNFETMFVNPPRSQPALNVEPGAPFLIMVSQADICETAEMILG